MWSRRNNECIDIFCARYSHIPFNSTVPCSPLVAVILPTANLEIFWRFWAAIDILIINTHHIFCTKLIIWASTQHMQSGMNAFFFVRRMREPGVTGVLCVDRQGLPLAGMIEVHLFLVQSCVDFYSQ